MAREIIELSHELCPNAMFACDGKEYLLLHGDDWQYYNIIILESWHTAITNHADNNANNYQDNIQFYSEPYIYNSIFTRTQAFLLFLL